MKTVTLYFLIFSLGLVMSGCTTTPNADVTVVAQGPIPQNKGEWVLELETPVQPVLQEVAWSPDIPEQLYSVFPHEGWENTQSDHGTKEQQAKFFELYQVPKDSLDQDLTIAANNFSWILPGKYVNFEKFGYETLMTDLTDFGHYFVFQGQPLVCWFLDSTHLQFKKVERPATL